MVVYRPPDIVILAKWRRL